MLSPERREKLKKAIDFVDASMRLEGFEKTEDKKIIDEALLAGRVDLDTVIREMTEYVREHKTVDGFLDGKEWVMKNEQ